MKKEYPPKEQLRREFGRNKEIPGDYEEVILQTLSHYPELKDTRIRFELKKQHPVPYGTIPSTWALLRGPDQRRYVISLLEEAELPVRSALFRNLPEEAQRAVIAHELGHVLQFRRQSFGMLLKAAYRHGDVFKRREIERDADLSAIQHGLGFELYVHAMYIRKIPGYTNLRKEIETDYLKPQEILDTLAQEPSSDVP